MRGLKRLASRTASIPAIRSSAWTLLPDSHGPDPRQALLCSLDQLEHRTIASFSQSRKSTVRGEVESVINLRTSHTKLWDCYYEDQGPLKIAASISREFSSGPGSIEFDEEPETEEEDEGQDDVLAAAGLETGVDASLTLAQQIRNIPEGPDQSEQIQRMVKFGPRPEDLADWLQNFKMKVVDVNRVSKGSPTGRVSQFSALVVAGNKNGVLGLGMGKAPTMGDAVKKANRQAVNTLFYVPRYNQATILHPLVSKYSKCIVKMYPKSSGKGCTASPMMKDICKLAGLKDIGIKTYGSRNIRNTIKALIRGLESQIPPQEQIDLPEVEAKLRRRPKGTPTVQTVGVLNL